MLGGEYLRYLQANGMSWLSEQSHKTCWYGQKRKHMVLNISCAFVRSWRQLPSVMCDVASVLFFLFLLLFFFWFVFFLPWLAVVLVSATYLFTVSTYLLIFLSAYLCTYLPINLPIYRLIYPSIHPSILPSFLPSFLPSLSHSLTRPFVYLFVLPATATTQDALELKSTAHDAMQRSGLGFSTMSTPCLCWIWVVGWSIWLSCGSVSPSNQAGFMTLSILNCELISG